MDMSDQDLLSMLGRDMLILCLFLFSMLLTVGCDGWPDHLLCRSCSQWRFSIQAQPRSSCLLAATRRSQAIRSGCQAASMQQP